MGRTFLAREFAPGPDLRARRRRQRARKSSSMRWEIRATACSSRRRATTVSGWTSSFAPASRNRPGSPFERRRFGLTPELLDRAVAGAGRPIKALLFTSPDNPLGRVASRDEISMVLEWADDRDLHVVFDEIYALSVFGESTFTSCSELLQVARRADSHRLGLLQGLRRFGSALRRARQRESCRSTPPSTRSPTGRVAPDHTQHVLGDMISDEAWVDSYIDSMREVLRGAYSRLSAALDAGRIRHRPAEAGVFVLLDLRSHLAAPTWEAEHTLWIRDPRSGRVNLTPGAACHVGEPGFFRLCYAGHPTDTVEIARPSDRQVVRLSVRLRMQ